jgi:hypothetical protein
MVLSPYSSKLQPTKPMLKFQICETLLLVFCNVFVDHTLPCLFKNLSCFGIYTKKIKHGIRLWVRVWNDTRLILLNATIMFAI